MVTPLAASDMTETSTSSSPNLGHDSGDISTPMHTPSGSGSSEQDGRLSVDGSRAAKAELDGRTSLDENKSDGEEEDDAAVLEDDPVEMASWAGEASIMGGSEAMQMVLLSFISIGITCASRFSTRHTAVAY